ncbi:MAG: HlyD family type I secretion periplasmic adaptor subunit [Hyphomonadaceae bacterium]
MSDQQADNAAPQDRKLACREARLARRVAQRKEAIQHVETQFLPASLEILETPPSPIGRSVLWLILSAAAAALLWACLAQVDIVAVSEGRIIPRGRLQTVEASEAGMVRALHVEEGQRVRAGELLIELDPTYADADAVAAQSEYAAALLARARADALIAYAGGAETPFVAPESADPAAAAAEAAAVLARITALRERLGGLDARIQGASAARAAAEETRLAIDETLPLAEEQLRARQNLMAQGFAPRMIVLREEERVISMRREAAARAAESRQASAEIAMLRRERAQALEDFRAQAAAEKAEAEAIVATRAEFVRKADQRAALQSLRSPVDGVVNEIAVTTIGDVVEAGAALVTIVPSGAGRNEEELIVEALVLNRDVGFVREGNAATIKLEAYPFTRHGYLEGIVEHVSSDAVTDEARGLVFPARVRISSSHLRDVINPRLLAREENAIVSSRGESAMQSVRDRNTQAQRVRYGDARGGNASNDVRAAHERSGLSPGMAAQVEIITGRRSVISYLLSPIARATDEAGRER